MIRYAMASIMTDSIATGNVLDNVSMLEGSAIIYYKRCNRLVLRKFERTIQKSYQKNVRTNVPLLFVKKYIEYERYCHIIRK